MKIAPKATEGFLSDPGKGHRACLLYGPDSGLVRERAKRISATLLSGNDDPFAFVELTEAGLLGDNARLADELSAISLMGGKRVIMVRDAGDKLTKIFESAVEYFNDDVFVIATADELPARSSLRGWFEKEPECASIACYKDEARDVQEVIRRTMGNAGIQLDREAMDYLTHQLGNDRYVTHQELEKLITYAGENKRLTSEDIRVMVDYNRETKMDDLVNAVADRNIRQLESMLTVLLREGAQPIMYLRTLQRYFNRLYHIRAQMAAGQSAEQVIGSLRPPVFFKQVPLLTRHVKNWDTAQIVKALQLLVSAELACKTSDMPVFAASSRKLLQVTQLR
jgi:DNA polymerase III subunit delta